MKKLSTLKGMGKAARFSDGGEVTEGQNSGIGDDTRARALAWARKMAEGGGEESPAAEPVAKSEPAPVRKKVGSAPVRKASTDTGDETSRLSARYAKPMSSYDRMNANNRSDDRAAASKRDSDRAILRDNIRKGSSGEVDSKTLLPVRRANGGLVKLGGLKSHGKAC